MGQYDFVSVERSMYKWWEEKGYFEPRGDPNKKSYVVPMPPPNVTGYLHMGHAMGTTLQVWLLLSCDFFLVAMFLCFEAIVMETALLLCTTVALALFLCYCCCVATTGLYTATAALFLLV